MIHMLVATHGPETCAAVVPEIMEKTLSNWKQSEEVSKKLGVTIQGSWVNMPGHITFIICDAPNAHAVNEMASQLKLMDWNTVVVHPVITLQEAMTRLQRASALAISK